MKTKSEICKTIALYMGYEIIKYNGRDIYNGNPSFKTVGQQKKLWNGIELSFTGILVDHVQYPFNEDFNLLVPVIHKIEKSGYVVHIAGIKYQIYKLMDEKNPIVSLVCGDLSRKTEMTCNLIIQFIEEHIL